MAFIDPTSQLGIPIWLLIIITIWEMIWTGLAMWRAAKLKHVAWFIIFLVVNLFGIPEIIYLIATNKNSRRR